MIVILLYFFVVVVVVVVSDDVAADNGDWTGEALLAVAMSADSVEERRDFPPEFVGGVM